jgi:hypothetical protein
MEILNLHSILMSYGDIIKLNYKFSHQTINELSSIQNWISAPNGKNAVNLTGPLEDLGLDSPRAIKHLRGQQYNDNLLLCPSVISFFDLWEELARCRAVHMNKGNFFRLHRDAFQFNEQFRIFIPLNKTSDDEWVFIYDGKIQRFEAGVPYILNTRKVHGSFSMSDNIYHILMSVFLTEKNLKQIMKLLPNCEDH